MPGNANLVEAQLGVLLDRNPEGRLTTTRGPVPRAAPRFFMARSRERTVWAARHDVGPEAFAALGRLAAAEPWLEAPDAASPPACAAEVRALLAPVASEWRGPAFRLPRELPRDDRAREVGPDSRAEWQEAFPWLVDEFDEVTPVAIAFEAGEAAAICHSPRGCTAIAAEAGVETRPGFRGRGLATAAVACWARAVQRSGRIALYSTSWENAASRAVARRLSASLYGEDWHLT